MSRMITEALFKAVFELESLSKKLIILAAMNEMISGDEGEPETEETETEQPKTRRGRPKGSQNKPKTKRGRPYSAKA
jgi:hypothetical protein